MKARTQLAAVIAVVVLVSITFTSGRASAQACCVGASGLTPGWLGNHERWLVGAQLRLSSTHGSYPARGTFYRPDEAPRDARIEPSLFTTARVVPRGQIGVFAPLVAVRRRAGGGVEERVTPGDVNLSARYDFIRAGESRIPGLALLVGATLPSGTPPDEATGRLAADTTGLGTWEGTVGLSVEQVFGKVVLHGTALVGLRAPRDVLGVEQTLGPRALYLLAGGYVFEGDVALLGTFTHASEGDATVAGDVARGTGFRTTQLAALVVVPISDTLRLRTSLFTDVPALGNNRPASGGTSLSLLKTWF